MNSSGKYKIAIFASGSGTNAEAIFRHFQHHPRIKVVLLLSNNPRAFALERAKKFDIPCRVFTKEQFQPGTEILDWLKEAGVTHVVLAGFLWLVPSSLLKYYHDKIVNIHPALLPRYGGKGMYGAKVHAAVKESGDSETGISIHLVNERFDEGRILFQARCPIMPEDTDETIANKVHALEHAHFPKVIEEWILESKFVH